MADNKLGPTGEYPDGVLKEDDDGELKMAIGNKDGRVFMDFGKQVTWIAFEPAGARELAKLLEEHADKAELGTN